MTDVSGTSNKIGRGFLDKSGQLKSKETLSKEDAELVRKTNEAAAVTSDRASVDGALKSVNARFNEKVSSMASRLNTQEENVKAARRVVDEQLDVAKKLKQAIKDGDPEEAEKQRGEFVKLESKRQDLSKTIKADNDEFKTEDRVVSFGNQIKGSVRTPEITFKAEASAQDNLDTVGGVNKLIDGLKDEKQSLKAQQVEVKDTQRELKSIVSEVEKESARISDDSIRSIDQAQAAADRVANAIRQNSSQALVAQNINASVVQSLLQ